jgi:hypothetical protein
MCTQSVVQYLECMKYHVQTIFQVLLTLRNENRVNQSRLVNYVDLYSTMYIIFDLVCANNALTRLFKQLTL